CPGSGNSPPRSRAWPSRPTAATWPSAWNSASSICSGCAALPFLTEPYPEGPAMPIETVADLLAALRGVNLLAPARAEELTRAAPGDARGLARELVRRGLLTPFQVNELFLGRGQGLVLGPYVLLDRLGVGGMGEVFKA